MDDILTLISEAYTKNTIGVEVPTETTTDVWAHKRSITRAEWFEGARNGLNPSMVLITPRVNYSGQKLALWQGVRYFIYRTYSADNSDDIELYLERRST